MLVIRSFPDALYGIISTWGLGIKGANAKCLKRIKVRFLGARRKTRLSRLFHVQHEKIEISENIEESWKNLKDRTYSASFLRLPKCKHQSGFDDNNTVTDFFSKEALYPQVMDDKKKV